MNNIATIFAGGSGIRMNTHALPKQFLQLHGKEVIIYTIEQFEQHPAVDAIAVACIKKWIPFLQSLLEKYQIKKVKWVVEGGKTGQESICKILTAIKNDYREENAVVLIHDGVRPLINSELITHCIDSVEKYGSAITVTPEIETVVALDNHKKIISITDRSTCYHAKAPQCFRLNDIYAAHLHAKEEGLNNVIDSASLMAHYGHELYTVEGGYENIKITTPTDFYLFRALFEAQENLQKL
ncbi:MAG: 2-C-methyl-D-erythritol 4-phosphate cytidylyltransferase [Lentimicrobiaceae bacterium]|nr:2-C-methyl-D-erythritol 4-phosphate cytidylyltransferase [Lentimicrobiaceae bacterium]